MPHKPAAALQRFGFAAGLWVLASCAPAAVPAAAPPPLTEIGIEAIARVLQSADQRRFNADALTAAVADAHPEVRRQAALAMAGLRDPAALPLLQHQLADPDTAVAATAAFALGQVGDTAAVPALVALLEPARARAWPAVAAEAAAALGKLRNVSAHQALRQLLGTAPVDAPSRGTAADEALLAIWRYPRGEDFAAVARWLAAGDAELRWRASYALVRRPDPRAVPLLLPRITDLDARVRALAARGLSFSVVDSAAVEDDAVVMALLGALRDADYAVRVNALRSLATFDAPRALSAVASALEAADESMSLAAADALTRAPLGARQVIPRLRDVATDPDRPEAVRASALAALARLAPVEALPVALEFADDAAWRLRIAAARVLALAGTQRAVLLRLVRDADGRTAAAALVALVEAAGDSAAPPQSLLVEALGSADPWVRTTALEALAKQPDPALLPVLLDAYGRAAADTTNDAGLAALNALAALAKAGTLAERALFARFPRPADQLLRARAIDLFGNAARDAWGDVAPVATERSLEDYRAVVRRWIAPAAAGMPPPRVSIRTRGGTIELELFAADAPLTVQNWVALAEQGFFDGQQWPRVVPNFVIQGGDPRGDTNGGPGYSIRDEINRNLYLTGTLGMALSGPDTGGSQFFITHSPQPHLDGTYTVFGRVTSGMSVVEAVLPGDTIVEARINR